MQSKSSETSSVEIIGKDISTAFGPDKDQRFVSSFFQQLDDPIKLVLLFNTFNLLGDLIGLENHLEQRGRKTQDEIKYYEQETNARKECDKSIDSLVSV